MLPKFAAVVETYFKSYYKQRDAERIKRNFATSMHGTSSASAAQRAPGTLSKRILQLSSENAILRSTPLAKIAADVESDSY
jgi:hypothetical protein